MTDTTKIVNAVVSYFDADDDIEFATNLHKDICTATSKAYEDGKRDERENLRQNILSMFNIDTPE